MGLTVNDKKTKISIFKRRDEKIVCSITLDEERIEQVDNYVYRGSLFTDNEQIDGEIFRRISDCRKVISSVGAITRSKNMANKAKIAIYNSALVTNVM